MILFYTNVALCVGGGIVYLVAQGKPSLLGAIAFAVGLFFIAQGLGDVGHAIGGVR
jgi:hypothetical protein